MQWIYNFAPVAPNQTGKRPKALPIALPIAAASLGNKAANLFAMCALGLPVPPGFTLRAELCTRYHAKGRFPADLKAQLQRALTRLEAQAACKFADPARPLVVSVRAGARDSMPGMLDTILNLGLNDRTVEALATQSGSLGFAYDSYRRLLVSYGIVVGHVAPDEFDDIWENYKLDKGTEALEDFTQSDWLALIGAHKALIRAKTGKAFPQNPQTQLWQAIGAVFASWHNARATNWRRLHNVDDDGGMAVSVQQMVFGNWNANSATGVAFTRNPSTGAPELYGEYLPQAQGEDVVAGLQTPYDIVATGDGTSLEERMPHAFRRLTRIARQLERHFGDVQDIEFTVQDKKLFLLQTRRARRNIQAAFKIAVQMVKEKLISKSQALLNIDPYGLTQLLHPTLADETAPLLVKGLPASPGAVSGALAFSSQAAERAAARERRVILVRAETSPEDIQGMHAARGILTSHGGMTSHAAVVARGLGRPCVCGASELQVDADKKELRIGTHILKERDVITIDGTSGKVMLGEIDTRAPKTSKEFEEVMRWADAIRVLGVRANADTLREAETALAFGADGLGLVRTESSFYAPRRVRLVRTMLLSKNAQSRASAIKKLLALMRSDFIVLFLGLKGRPITIRLLDPPLQDFLPSKDKDIAALARYLDMSPLILRRHVQQFQANNPGFAHRGSRVAISHDEIFELQLTAVFEAMLACAKRGQRVVPEIMIPFVSTAAELRALCARAREIAAPYYKKQTGFAYRLGVMIEVPRAALQAGTLAPQVDFFSFGTNDLTQTSFGMSRDDVAAYLNRYLRDRLLIADPFAQLDEAGVGELMRIACTRARARVPQLPIAICGDHAGDPASINFCAGLGLNYVSCTPYHVPIARLSAAQAALRAAS